MEILQLLKVLFQKWLGHAIVFIVLLMGEAVGQEQPTTTMFQIETRDGNEYIGSILERNNQHVVIQTENLGRLTIQTTDIVRIDPVRISQVKEAVYWFDNPQSTRYLWSPNGFGLKKGEGYYQNIWVLFNQFSVGVTDHFSLGAGVVPLFLFAAGVTPVWITPKLSIPVAENKINIGAGGLFGTVIGTSETAGYGIAYGTLTLGNRDQNVSIGMGYGFAGSSWANRPALSFSGIIRTGARGYLLTENYFLSTDGPNVLLLSLAGRRIINKTGLDFGLFIPATLSETLIAIPWLGFTVPFGNRKHLRASD